MPGSKLGGLRAAATNKKRHGEDFYQRMGRIGGQRGHTGGFYANRELAREAGRKGGLKSRRSKAKEEVEIPEYAIWKNPWKVFQNNFINKEDK